MIARGGLPPSSPLFLLTRPPSDGQVHGAKLGFSDPKTIGSAGAYRQLPDGSLNGDPTGFEHSPPGGIQVGPCVAKRLAPPPRRVTIFAIKQASEHSKRAQQASKSKRASSEASKASEQSKPTLTLSPRVPRRPGPSRLRTPHMYSHPPPHVQEFAPTVMAAVPKIWDILKKGVEDGIGKKSPVVQTLFQAAFSARSAALKQGRESPLLGLLFKKVRLLSVCCLAGVIFSS